jgi:hypothetical protein
MSKDKSAERVGRCLTSAASRRIGLPSDLARSLEYLDDADLRKLQDALTSEIERRTRMGATRRSTRSADTEAVQISQGQVNLIQASFKAGVKPAAIARTLGISPSLVRRILQSNTSPSQPAQPSSDKFGQSQFVYRRVQPLR